MKVLNSIMTPMTNTASNAMNPASAAALNLETDMMAANSRESGLGHADMRQDLVNLQ